MLVFFFRIVNQILRGYISPTKLVKSGNGSITYDVAFRCLPPDLSHDFYHMNNAKFFRVAELARWRVILAMFDGIDVKKTGAVFVVKHQTSKYFKEILPFRRYVVRTKVFTLDNKLGICEHTFMQDPATVQPGKEPILHATVVTHAVIKDRRSGKTIRLNELDNDFFRSIIPPTDNNS